MPTIINGDGVVTAGGTASTQGRVVLAEQTGNGTNTVTLQAPASLAADLTFTMPTADGTNGQFLQTNGSGALAFASVSTSPTLIREARTSNTQLGTADVGKLIAITSGTFTQTFAAAATLGNGWFVYLQNAGTGQITLDPNGSETIDGLTSYIMYPNELRIVTCNGTSFTTVILDPFVATFDSTATFTTPPGYAAFTGYLWGAGGSGGLAGASSRGGGGGGGACVPFYLSSTAMGASQTITIGAGGASRATANAGLVGGNSSIGSLVTSYGGGGGGIGAPGGNGGGGGGALSAGQGGSNTDNYGGNPNSYTGTAGNLALVNNNGYGGGSSRDATLTGSSAFGGGAGGTSGLQSGSSVYGGSGGAGTDNGGTSYTAGVSVFGGAGGNTVGAAGAVPGGGGASGYGGTASGAGGNGRCIIRGVL